VCGLAHLAQLAEARTDTPAILAEAVVSDVPSEIMPRRERMIHPPEERIVDDPDRMIAKTLRTAAIRDMALEPDRKPQILERVHGIQTYDEAADFIEEVEHKLKAARVDD
jgi:hypothetical protein